MTTKNTGACLFLIGGGVMRYGETDKIDSTLLKTTKSDTPRVLLIPAASKDKEEYIKDFTARFEAKKAQVHCLYLITGAPTQNQIEKEFTEADIIYFCGGDALVLLEVFRKYGLGSLCRSALKKGAVIAGLSAGAAIWGQNFLNFSRNESEFINPEVCKGLGFVNGLIIPHYNDELQKNAVVKQLLGQYTDMTILGIPDCTFIIKTYEHH